MRIQSISVTVKKLLPPAPVIVTSRSPDCRLRSDATWASSALRPRNDVLAAGRRATLATSLVIEQFLRAVNAKDLDTMARLFGTRDGSIRNRDPKQQVEDRGQLRPREITAAFSALDGERRIWSSTNRFTGGL